MSAFRRNPWKPDVCILVTGDEAGIDLQEIHRFLREIGVAAYKMPDQIEWVETWPLTSVGKIDKKALERMAQEK